MARRRNKQWNVLADGLAQHGDFIKVPSAALEWETRLPLILDEIDEASADICAIQELNRYEELRALLALRGYDGCFFPKHVSPASRNRCPPDGLAIFYKKDRLEVAAQPADRLQGQQVVVVTTHLKAKEGQEMDNIRLSQGQGGQAGSGQQQQQGSHLVPVIIAGDFNTIPTSAVCKMFQGHTVPLDSLWDLPNSGEPTAAASDAPGAAAGGVDTEFSTWKFRSVGESKRVIDYILWTRGRGLQPVARWRMLTEQEIGPTGLPTLRYPSDHVALCADFQWTFS
ncbi:endo/exonuclease/phosphatase domain-containing protein [Haematococcus lacustris]|uniref:Endo/exonuclease/phosphatase domain-containing protein n=1 Tax=Haematococcus lacustris TaxID=44745 RepID=A0A699Y8R1_HAELA|nr:endo/exonuclease/phosphatase domain-containing protein [Haematococcus lacustris]